MLKILCSILFLPFFVIIIFFLNNIINKHITPNIFLYNYIIRVLLSFKSTTVGRIWRHSSISVLTHGVRQCRAPLREPSSCVRINRQIKNYFYIVQYIRIFQFVNYYICIILISIQFVNYCIYYVCIILISSLFISLSWLFVRFMYRVRDRDDP